MKAGQKKIKDEDGVAYTYYELGDIYLRSNQYDERRSRRSPALLSHGNGTLISLEPNIISRMARLCLRKGEFDKANKYYDSAELLHAKPKTNMAWPESALGKGRVSLKQEKFDNATNQVLEA